MKKEKHENQNLSDKTKILIENQHDKRYMFPGGRIDVHEDSKTSIERELLEELNLKTDLNLKYIVEMFIKSPKTKYHEIGFYYLMKANIEPKDFTLEENDKGKLRNHQFKWITKDELKTLDVRPSALKDVVLNELENQEIITYIKD